MEDFLPQVFRDMQATYVREAQECEARLGPTHPRSIALRSCAEKLRALMSTQGFRDMLRTATNNATDDGGRQAVRDLYTIREEFSSLLEDVEPT